MRKLTAILVVAAFAALASACAERTYPPSTEPPTPSGPVVNPPPG